MIGARSASWAPAGAGDRRWLFNIALVLGCAVTVAAAIITNGNVVGTVAPVLGAVLLTAIWVTPIRIPLLALVFFGLALDATGDGPWNSPVAPLGHLLMHNLNKSVPIEALALPLIAVALIYLLVIHIHRFLAASQIDEPHARPAAPMVWAMGFSVLAVVGVIAIGFKRGGDGQMAKIQVQSFVLVLLMAYLLAMSLRPKDYRMIGGLVVAAACIKSVMALWVYYTIVPTPAVATTHGDSLLFAGAFMIPLALFAERPGRRNGLLCLLTLPLILEGIVANNRRLAWAELAIACTIFLFISRRTPLKRTLARACAWLLPVLVIYVTVGWDSKSGFFAPVKTLRSMTDADVDRSTLFRDFENFNLIFTMTNNPFTGTGLGHPYSELIKNDDISFFREYRFMPHNSILGLWAYGGMIGFTGIWIAIVVGIFMATRSYYRARSPEERIAAFTALIFLLNYEMQCWGDIGFSEPKSVLLVGPALAVAGQLAVTTGAWRGRSADVARQAR